MAQHDVYEHPGIKLRAEYPFVVALQSDLLASLDTCVVAPLRRAGLTPAIRRLNPEFVVMGVKVVLVPTEIVGVRRAMLGPVVANLASERYVIVGALDLMLTGV